MEYEDIRVGDLLNLRVRVCRPLSEYVGRLYLQAEIPNKSFDSTYVLTRDIIPALSPVTLENGTKNTEPAPKYDPCRKFRKGDIVAPCSVNGRWCSHVWEDKSSIHYEVAKDEDPITAHMEVKDTDSPHPFLVHAAFFKLVTPVEEIEPYRVGTGIDSQLLYCNNKLFAKFVKTKDAKRFCCMLNDAHRKEQK